MKSKTTPTLKLTQLPNGGLEIVREYFTKWDGGQPNRSATHHLELDEREAKALKDFLNEPDPTST